MKKFKIMDKRLFDYEIEPNPIVKREAPNVVIFSNTRQTTGKKNNEEDSANIREKQRKSESVNSVHISDELPSPAKKNKTKLTIEDYRKLNRNRNNEEKRPNLTRSIVDDNIMVSKSYSYGKALVVMRHSEDK